MEAIRPHADAYLVKLLKGRKMRRLDFAEESDGTVRILAPLTHDLALAIPTLRRKAAPVVERAARTLIQASGRGGRLPTPLTHDNNSAAQSEGRVGERRKEKLPSLSAGCRTCGLVLEDRDRLYCDDCLTEARLAQPKTMSVAHERLRELRESGDEVVRRPEVRKKIGTSNRARQRAIIEWEAIHGKDWDPEAFRQQILPGLQGVTVTHIATVSGLSVQYCSTIRRGRHVPHPMHWEALSRLLNQAG